MAQIRDFAVVHCPAHRTVLANRSVQRSVQRQVQRAHHEHILIFTCESPRMQVWCWTTSLSNGRRRLYREQPFFSTAPPARMVARIRSLEVGLEALEGTALTDVLDRVRSALLPESNMDRFAKYPAYAAESDRLALAMKRGEAGAFQAFVEFHMPLPRSWSRMLIRAFGMESKDADQIVMIGLGEAARHFDPDRGCQFSIFAGYWIRHCCQRYGLKAGLPIRMPPHFFWPCFKMAIVEARLIASYDEREAGLRFEQELAKAGIDRDQWQCFCTARRFSCFSELDLPPPGGNSRVSSYGSRGSLAL